MTNYLINVDKIKAINKVYNLLGIEDPDIVNDFENYYITEHETPDGRAVIWYLDDSQECAVYVDTLEELSKEEILKELC